MGDLPTEYSLICTTATIQTDWPQGKTDLDCRLQCLHNCISFGSRGGSDENGFNFGNMVKCLSDPALLGCEVKMEIREHLMVQWRRDGGKLVFTLDTTDIGRVDWATLTQIKLEVHQNLPDMPPKCYSAVIPVTVLAQSSSGAFDRYYTYLKIGFNGTLHVTVPGQNFERQPDTITISFTASDTTCVSSEVLSVKATGASITPLQYHTLSRCAGWTDCTSCLAAKCNWCEWSCDSSCPPLPSWVPDYSWSQLAYEKGQGRCGIHPFVCRETVGTFNACKGTDEQKRDLAWSLILFVIPMVLIGTIFQIKNRRKQLFRKNK